MNTINFPLAVWMSLILSTYMSHLWMRQLLVNLAPTPIIMLLFINPLIQVSERCHRSFQTEPLSVDLDVTSDSDGVQPGANQVHIDHASERLSCHTKSRLAGVLAPWTLLFQYWSAGTASRGAARTLRSDILTDKRQTWSCHLSLSCTRIKGKVSERRGNHPSR